MLLHELHLHDDLDPAHPTVSGLLLDAGYQTAVVGKWHLITSIRGSKKRAKCGKITGKAARVRRIRHRRDHGPLAEIARESRPGPTLLSHVLLQSPTRTVGIPSVIRVAFRRRRDISEPATLFEDQSHRCAGSLAVGSTMLQLSERMSNWEKSDYPTGNLDVTGMSGDDRIRAA